MIVDGVLFKERKDLTKTLNDEGVEESHLIHTRVIGERSYTAIDFFDTEMIETDMDDSQLENFKNEWEEKSPIEFDCLMSREDEPGLLTRFIMDFIFPFVVRPAFSMFLIRLLDLCLLYLALRYLTWP